MNSAKFTQLQLDEICYKLSIVRDEPDLLDTYECTEQFASDLHDIFYKAKPGDVVKFTPEQAEIIVNELQNHCDNFAADVSEGQIEALATLNSMRQAMRKIEQAVA